MTITEFQLQIEQLYSDRDRARGGDGTFRWFIEEVGELAKAIRGGDEAQLREEFSDVAAWLFTLASLQGIDMEVALRRYTPGCPKCNSCPCACA